MNNILDSILLTFTLLLGLTALLVWLIVALAIFRSHSVEESWRGDPLKAFIVLLFSPGVLLGHLAFRLMEGLWRLARLVLLCGLVLLGVLISPVFLLAIPVAFLVFKLIQAAAPLGGRILNLSLDFFNQLDFWFGGRKQERLS